MKKKVQRPPVSENISAKMHERSAIEPPATNPVKNPASQTYPELFTRVLLAVGGAVGGAFLSVVAIWVTNTWQFMQERTFGELDKQIAELEELQDRQAERIAELEETLPLAKLYPADFVELKRFDTDMTGPITVQLGPCPGDDCHSLEVSTTKVKPRGYPGLRRRTLVKAVIQITEKSTGATIHRPMHMDLVERCFMEFQTSTVDSRLVVESITRDSVRFGLALTPRLDGPENMDRGPWQVRIRTRIGPAEVPECQGGELMPPIEEDAS
ncbi:hypothetical protein K2X89_07555 [Myxococcota bacterium]|nr:hypothetical protein [Myxococcota bacterium]